jgi:hypothetical protein
MELLIQFLDELEDWLLVISHVWQTIAWRIAGALSLLMVTVIAAFPV